MRTPLRPLARVLEARDHGENPDHIEAEERAKRNMAVQAKMRRRSESRLVVLGLVFFAAFATVGFRMAALAGSDPAEPRSAGSIPQIANQRADIVDRNGHVLATNLATTALYAQPPQMVDPVAAAKGLASIFTDLDESDLLKKFTGKRKFLWIKKKLSPEQQQLVHDLGQPGLLFGPREMRLYPNGPLAAHILGGASFGNEGVNAAELIGVAGIEKYYDTRLRDPAQVAQPLQLSIDLTAQATMRRVLQGGVKLMHAKGAAAILMDVHTGEIVSMTSLPDFDPNDRPANPKSKDASTNPLFNRAAQGIYELGSTFKLFTAATVLEKKLANENTMVDTRGPLKWGKFTIRDFHDYGKQLSLMDVIVHSSNIGTARLALQAGAGAQQEILEKLGFFDSLPVQISEARHARPLLPKRWSEISTMTVSYGHGIAATPLHLAAAYATITNGGLRVRPTLIKQDGTAKPGERVLSEQTSATLRKMLRQVVVRGTASYGEVKGYEVGGKTGSADKPDPKGGYYKNRVIATFASVFPASNPKYVLIVTLDEPSIKTFGKIRRTAGWTAVPVAAELIARLMPVLGEAPDIASVRAIQYTSAGN